MLKCNASTMVLLTKAVLPQEIAAATISMADPIDGIEYGKNFEESAFGLVIEGSNAADYSFRF